MLSTSHTTSEKEDLRGRVSRRLERVAELLPLELASAAAGSAAAALLLGSSAAAAAAQCQKLQCHSQVHALICLRV